MKNIFLIGAVLALVYFLMRSKKTEVAETVVKRQAFGDIDLTTAINLTLERVR